MLRPSFFRVWLARLVLASVSLAVSLGVAELFLAQVAPQWTWRRLMDGQVKHFALLRIFEPCDYLPFRLRPGAREMMHGVEFSCRWEVNEEGMRGSERSLDRSAGGLRVLALGDSFTAGHGVEASEAWPAVVESLLDRTDRRIEVLNAGYASGYSPDCYYAYLSHRGDAIQADIVVVALFAGNDLFEMLQHVYPRTDREGLPLSVYAPTRWVDEAGRRRLSEMVRPWAYRYPLLRESHLWILSCRAIGGGVGSPGMGHSPYRSEYSPAMQGAYEWSVRLLAGIGRLMEDRGGRVLVAVIPDVGQMTGELDYWQEATSGVDRDLDRPQSLWLRDLERLGIPALDLRAALAEAAESNPEGYWGLYFRHDRHLRPRGQRVVAAAIGAKVEELFGSLPLQR